MIDRTKNPAIPHKKYTGKAYCQFCDETVTPNSIPLKNGLKLGRYKTITHRMYLCPKCGGKVQIRAKKSGQDLTVHGSTMRIRRLHR